MQDSEDKEVNFKEKKKINSEMSQEDQLMWNIASLRVINDPIMRFQSFLNTAGIKEHQLTNEQKNNINENLAKINELSKQKRTFLGRMSSSFKNVVAPEANSEETYVKKIYEQIPQEFKNKDESISIATSSPRSMDEESLKTTLSKKPTQKSSYLSPGYTPSSTKVHPGQGQSYR
jgi:hypothetical protein